MVISGCCPKCGIDDHLHCLRIWNVTYPYTKTFKCSCYAWGQCSGNPNWAEKYEPKEERV